MQYCVKQQHVSYSCDDPRLYWRISYSSFSCCTWLSFMLALLGPEVQFKAVLVINCGSFSDYAPSLSPLQYENDFTGSSCLHSLSRPVFGLVSYRNIQNFQNILCSIWSGWIVRSFHKRDLFYHSYGKALAWYMLVLTVVYWADIQIFALSSLLLMSSFVLPFGLMTNNSNQILVVVRHKLSLKHVNI